MNQKVSFGILVVCICLLVGTPTYLVLRTFEETTAIRSELHKMRVTLDRYELYNQDIDWNETVNGVYFGDSHYCVWAKGRSEQDINRTENHEICHDFVKDYTNHFCGGKNET